MILFFFILVFYYYVVEFNFGFYWLEKSKTAILKTKKKTLYRILIERHCLTVTKINETLIIVLLSVSLAMSTGKI